MVPLNFQAEPEPVHVATIKRIRAVASRGMNDVPEEKRPAIEFAILQEISARVVGVELPSKNNRAIALQIAFALNDLRHAYITTGESYELMKSTHNWLLTHYPYLGEVPMEGTACIRCGEMNTSYMEVSPSVLEVTCGECGYVDARPQPSFSPRTRGS